MSHNVDAFDTVKTLSPEDFTNTGQVSSIAFSDNNIYAGTSDSQLCMYQVHTEMDELKELTQDAFFTMKKGLARKKPVQQIDVLPTLKFLVVLCNSSVTIHDLDTLMKHRSKIPDDSASCFCIDKKNYDRIAIVSSNRRNLQLYEYKEETKVFESFREISVNDRILEIVWYGECICIGFRQYYGIVDSNNAIKKLEVPIEPGNDPRMLVINNEELLLAASVRQSRSSRRSIIDRGGTNYLGVFLKFDGSPSPRNPIPWKENPVCLTTCGGYIVSVLPTEGVNITSLIDQKEVQTIPFEKPVTIASSDRDVDDKKKKVLVASANSVISLFLTPIEKQLKQYLYNGLVNQAQEILAKTNPTEREIENFHAQAAFILLSRLSFHRASKHFTLSKLDPREILSIFPKYIVDDTTYIPSCPFIPKVKIVYRKTGEEKFNLTSIDELVSQGLAHKMKSDNKQELVAARLSHSDLVRAASIEIAIYLWDNRTNWSDAEVELAVDTALLWLLVDLEDTSFTDEENNPCSDPNVCSVNKLSFTINDLLFPKNNVMVKPSVELLLRKKFYYTLGQLYLSKNRLRQALEVWQNMGTGRFQDAADCIIDTEDDGLTETIKLLKTMPDDPLLWEFSKWVLYADAQSGMQIFTTNDKRDEKLSPGAVVKYLERIREETPPTSESYEYDYVEVFLEYVVYEQKSNDNAYHDQLGYMYLKKVKMLKNDQNDDNDINNNNKKRIKGGQEPGLLGYARRKLLKFLKESLHYNVVNMLLRTENQSDLYEEMIIMNSRLGEHSKVLHIYVDKLNDFEGAANYCLNGITVDTERMASSKTVESTPDEIRSAAFVELLRIYFDELKQPEQGIKLLNKYSTHINPVDALKILPQDLPISSVDKYLSIVIPHILHKRRTKQIINGLSKTLHLETKAKLSDMKSRRFYIDDMSRCPVCRKPIDVGRQFVKIFSYHGSLPVHWNCADVRSHVSKPKVEKQKIKSLPYYS